MPNKELTIDLETFSDVSLKECGLFKYVESSSFEILLFAWAFGDEQPHCVSDIKRVPVKVIEALLDNSVTKFAFNAAFEITCIEKALNLKLNTHQWRCTMVQCMMIGLPGSLDSAGKALKLDTVKDSKGKALINFFTKPCKPKKANNFSSRNFMKDFPEKAFDFQEYCCTDVIQERKVRKAISFFTQSQEEHNVWVLDQKINKRGVMIDSLLARNAVLVDNAYKVICAHKFHKLTGITKANSLPKLKAWILDKTGKHVSSLNKKEMPAVKALLKGSEAEPVLLLREELSKTSTAKYVSALRFKCNDGKVKGLLQYYGASRTGRWGGRGLQIHNLKRNTMEQLDMARQLVKEGNLEALTLLFHSPSEVLSQLTRTVLIASPNNNLICADYSAIEARVTAWLANEKWRLDIFKTHGKIYEASAAMMFKVPIEKVTKGSDMRQKGKVSELALGFGGGVEALKRMGALDMGIQEDELPDLLSLWRKTSPNIVKLWKDCNACAVKVIENPLSICTLNNLVKFQVKNNILWITLPSGRALAYWTPRLIKGKFNSMQISYFGIDQNTKQWSVQTTYGGKLIENIVQGIARDLLADGLVRLDKSKFDIVGHVHDEAIIDHPIATTASAVIKINKLLSESPPWAKGLPLTAECFVTKYYKKE